MRFHQSSMAAFVLCCATAAPLPASSVQVHDRSEWHVTRSETTTTRTEQRAGSGPLPAALAAAYGRMLMKLQRERPAIAAGLDADGDEVLQADELHGLLKAHAEGVVARFDADRSGDLSWDEIAAGAGQPTRRERIAAFGGAVSGGRAHIYVGNQQAYVADWDTVGNQYEPRVSIIGTGTVLDVADPMVDRYQSAP